MLLHGTSTYNDITSYNSSRKACVLHIHSMLTRIRYIIKVAT